MGHSGREERDVSALDRFPVSQPLAEGIEKLIDKDPILVVKARHHALPLDPDWLDHEDDDQDRHHPGKENVPEEDPQFAPESPTTRSVSPQRREVLNDLDVPVIFRGDA